MHLVACCYYKDARVHCEVLKIRSVPHKFPRLPGVPYGVNLVVRGGMWSEETNSYELIPQDPTVCLIQWILQSEVPLSRRRSTDARGIHQAK